MPSMPKTIAGRYVVREEIGRGGMGVVYRAQDEKFEAEVAIKVMNPKHASADAVARLKREAKLGNRLGKQDGLVRALDWGRLSNGSHYLVLDYVSGAGDLNLKIGSLIERVNRVYEAAVLVRKAHEAGVLHRDVKPANFLVDEAGALHLTDFGIAKRIDEADDIPSAQANAATQPVNVSPELTAANVGLGTPYYMPPEQFEDASTVDARADVYALGVMLFQALTGVYPFPGKNPAEVYGGVMKARYGQMPKPSVRDHLRAIPAAIDRIVNGALAPVAEDRFQSVEAFLTALDDSNWKAGLAGVSPLVGGEGNDGATVAFPVTGGATRAPRPLSTGLTRGSSTSGSRPSLSSGTPTQHADRCPGCGHEPLRGDLCPECGADVIALRTQTRLEVKRTTQESEAAAREQEQRRKVSGSGIDYGGFQIPKIAWFVVGAMVVTGILIGAIDWTPKKKPTDPSDASAGETPPTENEDVELVDADELTDPLDLSSQAADDYEFFLEVHESWRKWNDYDVADARAEVLAELPELEDAFETYELRFAGDTPETRCQTPAYSFEVIGEFEPEIRARIRKP